MEQSEFDKRFSKIKATFNLGFNSYRFKNAKDVWENVGSNLLDKNFTELAELYLESNDNQKSRLYLYCGEKQTILENLWYFIRRIGVLIRNKDDKRWFELGIAGALMDGGRADFRDLIVSLLLLRFIAEKREIDVNTILDTFIQSTDGHIKGILENVRNHSKSSIHSIVETFGPVDWKRIK